MSSHYSFFFYKNNFTLFNTRYKAIISRKIMKLIKLNLMKKKQLEFIKVFLLYNLYFKENQTILIVISSK